MSWRAIVLGVLGCGCTTDPRAVDENASRPSQSCEGLAATCGASGTRSCCEVSEVPGGTFLRSFDGVHHLDDGYPATVSPFGLDTFEVTVGRFRAFVDDGRGTRARPPSRDAGARPLNGLPAQGGWDPAWDVLLPTDSNELRQSFDCLEFHETWTDEPGDHEHRPMNCITWYEAMAFCIWDGGYLPTEAEWNFAAAGGDQQRVFAWSDPPTSTALDPSRASYLEGVDCVGDGLPGCELTDILHVGSRPAGDGRWGHADLTGNLSEMVLDWRNTTPNAQRFPLPCDDCAHLIPNDVSRQLRGGGWGSQIDVLRVAFRDPFRPEFGAPGTGVRCARPPATVD